VCNGFFIGQGRIKGTSVQWNRQQGREGTVAWAHSAWNLLAKLERSFLLVQIPLCLFTCCIPCLGHHIYTLSFYTSFPRGGGGGGLSRVMLTKNTCVQISWMLSV
jgi:hypothetical protein